MYKRTHKKKGAAFLLSVILLLQLTACGAGQSESLVSDLDAEVSESSEAGTTTLELQYEALSGLTGLMMPDSLTLLNNTLWFLARDSQYMYACRLDLAENLSATPEKLCLLEWTSSFSVNSIAFSEDFLCYITLSHITDEVAEETTMDSCLYVMQSDGSITASVQLSALDAFEDSENLHADSLAIAVDGTILLTLEGSLYQLDTSGNVLKRLDFDGHGYTVATSSTGEIWLNDMWDMELLYSFDLENFTIGEDTISLGDCSSWYSGSDAYAFYGIGEDGIYGISEDVESPFLLLELEDTAPVRYAYPLSDGWILSRRNFYNSDVTVYHVTEGESIAKTVLTMAVSDELSVVDQYIEKVVNQFNFESSTCEIEPVVYTDQELRMAISTGEIPDLFLFDQNGGWESFTMSTCVRSGLLQDMTPLLTASDTLSEDMLIPNILETLQWEDGLYALPYGWRIRTIYADASYGVTESWTLDEFMSVALNLPEGLYIKESTDTMLLEDLMGYCLLEFVDLEAGACDFQNEQFYTLLEVCTRQPSSMDELPDDDDAYLLQYLFTLFDLTDICGQIETLDDTAVLVGFPGAGGGQFILSSTVALSVSCKDTDAAWDFLEMLVTADTTTIYSSLLEEDLQDELRTLRGSYTSETVETLENIIRSASTVTALSSPIPDIVGEESAAYFAGEFTAEEIAARIQDRVDVWLAEQE